MKVSCPKCHSTDVQRWTSRNILLTFLEMLIHGLLIISRADTIATLCGVDAWQLKRTCRKCGHKFHVSTKPPPDHTHCRKCQYNLTGNISGRCSECGWQIPNAWRPALAAPPQTIDEESS